MLVERPSSETAKRRNSETINLIPNPLEQMERHYPIKTSIVDRMNKSVLTLLLPTKTQYRRVFFPHQLLFHARLEGFYSVFMLGNNAEVVD